MDAIVAVAPINTLFISALLVLMKLFLGLQVST